MLVWLPIHHETFSGFYLLCQLSIEEKKGPNNYILNLLEYKVRESVNMFGRSVHKCIITVSKTYFVFIMLKHLFRSPLINTATPKGIYICQSEKTAKQLSTLQMMQIQDFPNTKQERMNLHMYVKPGKHLSCNL